LFILIAELRIEEERHAFEQADADKGSGLDEIEWLSFRHPEHSKVMLREMAEEILKAFGISADIQALKSSIHHL